MTSNSGGNPGGRSSIGSPAHLIVKLFDKFLVASNVLGSVWIITIAILVNADVLSRALLGRAIVGVPEIVSQTIVAIVFLQMALTLKVNRFIRSDALTSRLVGRSPGVVRGLSVFNNLSGCVVSIILIFPSWTLLTRAIEKGEYVGEYGHFTMPVWPLKMIIVVGAIALGLQYIRRLRLDLTGQSPLEDKVEH